MLTAALDGLVARFGLQGERARRGRRRRRAQARAATSTSPASACSAARSTRHARLRHAAGVRHRPRGGGRWSPTRSRSARSSAGIAGGVDTTCDAPLGVNDDLRRILLEANNAKSSGRAGQAAGPPAPGAHRARHPAQRRAAHRPVDGRAPGAHRRALGHHARGAGRADRGQPPAPGRRLRPRLLRRPRHARTSASSATRTCAPTPSTDKLAKLKPVFGDDEDGR